MSDTIFHPYIVKEFQRLFFAARHEHRVAGRTVTSEIPAHQAALDFARQNNVAGADILLDASMLGWQDKDEDALRLLEAQDSAISPALDCVRWFLRGIELAKLKRYDEAIDAHYKVIEMPDCDIKGYVWSGLGIAYANMGDYERAVEAYVTALDDPKNDLKGYAWSGLGFVYGEKGEYDRAIEACLKALDDSNYRTRGTAWNNLGSHYNNKGDYDEAIKACLKVFEDPTHANYVMVDIVWINLGNAYQNKGDYGRAIYAYHEALKGENPKTLGVAWNNLGNAYQNIGDYEQALKSFNNALQYPDSVTPGYAWNNIGNVYQNMSEYEKAIEAYRTALRDDGHDARGATLSNLAIALYVSGKGDEAQKVLENGLDLDKDGDPISKGFNPIQARSILTFLGPELRPEALSREDRALLEPYQLSAQIQQPVVLGPVEKPGREQQIREKIEEAKQTQYDRYAKSESSKRNDVLSILRGWSSAVTLLEGTEGLWRGGGYLLKWQGRGIAIDPGFDFLRHLHDARYHAREIDVVLVSHNHPDHNADLKDFDDLRYELFKRRDSDPHGKVSPYLLIWDKDSDDDVKFSTAQPAHRLRSINFDLGRANPCDTLDVKKLYDLPISVTYFKVWHGDLDNAVGFRVELRDETGVVFTLGYTGDTEFFPELGKYLAECDILLAHISQPDVEEFNDVNRRKKIHLGYRGLGDLIKIAQPKLTLVGEFWAGLADLRIDLVQGLRSLTGVESIFPAGLGMHISLPTLEIECSKCGKNTLFKNIHVTPPANDFGNLSYLCRDCLLHPSAPRPLGSI